VTFRRACRSRFGVMSWTLGSSSSSHSRFCNCESCGGFLGASGCFTLGRLSSCQAWGRDISASVSWAGERVAWGWWERRADL
jgi:hypothetical protein